MKNVINPFRKNLARNYISDSGVFKQLDIEAISKNLHLEEKGRVAGQAEKPLTDSDSNDVVENKILDLIESEKSNSHDEAIKWFAAYRDRLKSLGIEALIQRLEEGKKKITVDIRATLSTLKDSELYQLIKDLKKQKSDLAYFKEDNMLSREPDYSDSKVLGFGLVFLVFLIESILNGYFFAKGHELGYLGGISIAIMISFVNVIINGYLLGWFFLRRLVHVKWLWKFVGLISFLLLLVLAPAFNLGVAHYRQAFIIQAENPSQMVMQTILSHPFRLNDFESYMLIIMGIAVTIIACIDFWTISEPYPGYEKKHKTLSNLQSEYAEKRASLVEELQNERDEGFDEIKTTLTELEARQEEYRVLIDRMKQFSSQITPHFDRLEQNGRQLLSLYRDANLLARTTPAPARFQANFVLKRPDGNVFQIPSQIDITTVLGTARREIPAMIESINNECETAIEGLLSLDDILN